jgi:molybdopterin synthase sulfur carrier subunit
MPVLVRIPTPLRSLTGDQNEVEASGASIREVLEDLERRYPGMRERLCDERGRLRGFVNIYVNQQDVRLLEGDETPVREGDEVSIIPSIAGGQT